MRNWGIVVTLFYALAILLLMGIGWPVLIGEQVTLEKAIETYQDILGERLAWVILALVVGGQGLLLFLSVDTSRKRLKPRTHLAISCLLTGILLAWLTYACVWSVAAAIKGDKVFPDSGTTLPVALIIMGLICLSWLLWSLAFYQYSRNSSGPIGHAVAWLLRGSVLELLIVIPCHVLVRHRKECSAPAVTAFGIETGIAVMLMAFGPSVLVLYKNRLDKYSGAKMK